MDRRDFLIKSAIMSSGLLGAGMLPGSRQAEASNRRPRRGRRHFTIDSWTHWANTDILDVLEAAVPIPGFQHVFRSLFANNPRLINVDDRLELMEQVGVDHHVLIPLPWIETIPTPFITQQVSYDAAQAINDDLAQMIQNYPDKFSAVALLPLLDREDCINELRTRVDQGFVGGLYVSGYNTKAADHPDFFDPDPDIFPPPFQATGVHHGDETLYGVAAELDVPLWLHPATPPVFGDYAGEDQTAGGPGSMYNIYQALTWLLDSSVAMVRMVFAGVFKKYPDLKVVTHHHGALIPAYAERLVYGWDFFEQNTGAPTAQIELERPYIDHFKNFYCDTATQGISPDLLKRAIDFFGPDRVLFGTDAPMDATGGEIFTQTAIDSVNDLNINNHVSKMIYSGNIARLAGLEL